MDNNRSSDTNDTNNMSDKRSKNKNDFKKVLLDFCKDLVHTFPEIKDQMHDDIVKVFNNEEEGFSNIYNYCKQLYPERFFDILYQNLDIFKDDKINTCFLPGIDFKQLWSLDITDLTRETIWKYLQLILFSVVSDISEGESFGDTAKLFEAINETEFKSKLDETINNIKNLFETTNTNSHSNDTNSSETQGINLEDLPDANQFHEHINNMMDGKLGKLAREIAEDTANELNIDPDNMSSANDYFQTLFKNPNKLMGLVKSVGDKLDDKIKSGDIKESELLEEASNIVKRMRDMPGMENIQSMLSKMGIPNLGGKNAKVNMGAVQNHLNQNLRMAKTKERLKKKLETDQSLKSNSLNFTQEELEREANIMKMLNEANNNEIENLIFRTGEKMEKSARSSSQHKPQDKNENQKNTNVKKNKVKKNK